MKLNTLHVPEEGHNKSVKRRKQLMCENVFQEKKNCFKKSERESLISFLSFISHYRKVTFCMGMGNHFFFRGNSSKKNFL